MESDLKPYKDRMKPFIFLGTVYSAGVALYASFYGEPSAFWLIYVSTLALLVALAIGLDAVFDSLREMLPPIRGNAAKDAGA